MKNGIHFQRRISSRSTFALILRVLIAAALGLFLCACAGKHAEVPSESSRAATLPQIGIIDLDPSAAQSTAVGLSEPETSAEVTLPDTSAAETAETAPETTAAETTEAAATETSAPETAAPAPETSPEATQPGTEAAAGVRVWMGDSRFVGIRDTVDYDRERDVFISGWGMGYDWMLATAFPEFDKLAAEKKIDICYWSLGANDITNDPSDFNLELAAKYAAEVAKLIARHPGTTFYLLSYGPVGEEGMNPNNIPDCAAYNTALRIFTDRVRELTGMAYIDQGEYIEATGFRVYDGCHYDAETNKRAYAYVIEQSGG